MESNLGLNTKITEWSFHVLLKRDLRTCKEVKRDKLNVYPYGANTSLYTDVNLMLMC